MTQTNDPRPLVERTDALIEAARWYGQSKVTIEVSDLRELRALAAEPAPVTRERPSAGGVTGATECQHRFHDRGPRSEAEGENGCPACGEWWARGRAAAAERPRTVEREADGRLVHMHPTIPMRPMAEGSPAQREEAIVEPRTPERETIPVEHLCGEVHGVLEALRLSAMTLEAIRDNVGAPHPLTPPDRLARMAAASAELQRVIDVNRAAIRAATGEG